MKLERWHYEMVVLLFLSFILIYFSSMTKILSEDEAVYIDTARDIAETGMYPAFDFLNNPKRIPPLFSCVLSPFAASLPMSKIVVSLFGVMTLIFTYLFCEKHVGKGTGIIGGALLFSIPFFVHFSMLDYTDIPIAMFSIISFYFFFQAKKVKSWNTILAGVFIGLGLLTKFSMALIPLTFLFYAVFKRRVRIWLVIVLIALLVGAPWIIRNYYLFGYPFFIGLEEIHNIFFGNPYPPVVSEEIASSAQPNVMPIDIVANLGLLIVFFAIMGFFHSYYERKPLGIFISLVVVVFIILWYSGYTGIRDIRYFSIIFPQIAVLGTIGFSMIEKTHKIFPALIVIVVVMSGFSGIQMAMSTSLSNRYDVNFVNSLNWIRENSGKDDVMMTVFCGAGIFYSGRDCHWPVGDLAELMTTSDDGLIKNILEKYKINYIVIDAGLIGHTYTSEGTSILGIFSLQFVDAVLNSDKFNLVWQSEGRYRIADGVILPMTMVVEVLNSYSSI